MEYQSGTRNQRREAVSDTYTYEIVSTDLGNFIISSLDLDDTLDMKLGGLTWGENKIGTAVFWTGDNAPQDDEEFFEWASYMRNEFERGRGDERMFSARIMLAAKNVEGERKNVSELRARIQTETEEMLAGFDPVDYLTDLMTPVEIDFADAFKDLLDVTIEKSEECGCADCVEFVNGVKKDLGE